MALRLRPLAKPAQVLDDHLWMPDECGCREVRLRPFDVSVEKTTHQVILNRGECRERSLCSELTAQCRHSRQFWQVGDTTVPNPWYDEAVPIGAKSSSGNPLVREVRRRRCPRPEGLTHAGVHAAGQLRHLPKVLPHVGPQRQERCAKLRVSQLVGP